MNYKRITNLIGHKKLKEHLTGESILGDYIISVNSPKDRTMVTRYISECMAEKIPGFFGEIDKILEYDSFSGSMEDAEKLIADIYTKTERFNSYKGVISLPFDEMAKHINSKPIEFMLSHLSGELGEDTVIVGFVSEKITANEMQLINHFKSKRNKPMFEFDLEPYISEQPMDIYSQCNNIVIKDVVTQNSYTKG